MRKKIITINKNGNQIQKEFFNIPFRFILAVLITVAETAMVVAIVVALMFRIFR